MSKYERLGLIAACTAVLWVFPSFGTQGMGTLRQAYGHVDRTLFAGVETSKRSELLLRTVDQRVATVVIPTK